MDSTGWDEEIVSLLKVKINHEIGILEFLEWENAWEQLFSWDAASEEANKQWMRLPTWKDFRWIINNLWIWEFKKNFTGCYSPDGNDIKHKNSAIVLWTWESYFDEYAFFVHLDKGFSNITYDWRDKNFWLSVRWIKK